MIAENCAFIAKLMELEALFEVGVCVSYDNNHTLAIEGTDYVEGNVNAAVVSSYSTEMQWDDTDSPVDVLSPLIEKIKADKARKGS